MCNYPNMITLRHRDTSEIFYSFIFWEDLDNWVVVKDKHNHSTQVPVYIPKENLEVIGVK